MLRAIKVRLYLNNEQANMVNSLLGSCRYVYNQALSYKQTQYKESKKNNWIKRNK